MLKMKSITNISILAIVMMSLISCGNDDALTDYRGQVKYETISVSSKLAGRISKIYVEEGQTVKKGDTLAYINIPEVNAKMMQAEGAINSAQGQLNMAYKGVNVRQIIDTVVGSGFGFEVYTSLSVLAEQHLVCVSGLMALVKDSDFVQDTDSLKLYHSVISKAAQCYLNSYVITPRYTPLLHYGPFFTNLLNVYTLTVEL